MLLEGGNLAEYTLRTLIDLYHKSKENDLAFELLRRYRDVSNAEKGEILCGLLTPHANDLSKIVASMGEDPQEEIQRLYVKLHELFQRDKFPHSNWKYWLARILKNDLINKKKKKNPVVSMPVEVLPEAEEERSPEQIEQGKLLEAIGTLSDKQRRAIELRYLRPEGKLMTYKEIANVMNCSPGQVHGYLDRAKEKLRGLLAAERSNL